MFKDGFILFFVIMGAIAILLGIVVIAPYTSTAIPECRVVVTNEAGKAIDNAEVYETAMFYGLSGGWAEKKTTDREGKVTFQARTVRGSLMHRTLSKLLMDHYHFSYGAVAYVSVCDEGKYAGKDLKHWEAGGTVHLVVIPGPCTRS
jgi:hypothetical protein